MTLANDLATWVAERTALMTSGRLASAGTGLTVIYADNASRGSGYARLICQAVTARIKEYLVKIDDTVCVLCQQPLNPDGAGRYPDAQQFKPPASRSARELGIQ